MVYALAGGLIATVSAAAVFDLRTRRIPNGLTVGAVGFALLVRAAPGGAPLSEGLMGLGLAAAILVPLFAARVVGGGDAKLLMAVGAFLGPRELLLALLATALAGGALSLIVAARQRAVLPVLLGVIDAVRYGVTLGRSGRPPAAAGGPLSVPYAVAVALGSFSVLFLSAGS